MRKPRAHPRMPFTCTQALFELRHGRWLQKCMQHEHLQAVAHEVIRYRRHPWRSRRLQLRCACILAAPRSLRSPAPANTPSLRCAGLGGCPPDVDEEDDAIKAVHTGQCLLLPWWPRVLIWSSAEVLKASGMQESGLRDGGRRLEGSLPLPKRLMAHRSSAIA